MGVWSNEDRLERFLLAAVLLEFLALTAIHLCAIPVHISRNYNEGWNAYFAQAAMNGGVLYPSIDSMLTNNYPPLSFYIVGLFGNLVGDNIVAGRLVATSALAVVAFNVATLSRWLGADRKIASLAAGVFLLGTYAVMPGYIAINDPQFLAYAFVTAAAVVFLKSTDSHQWRGMLISALLMTLGGLIKHSQISLPLALCTWAAIYDRGRFGRFLICAVMVGITAAAMAYAVWGCAMVDAVFFGVRVEIYQKVPELLFNDLPFVLPYIILTIAAVVRTKYRRKASFVVIYLAWSLLIGTWMLSSYGVNQNVMGDAVIALALASSLFAVAFAEATAVIPWRKTYSRVIAILLMILPCMGASLYAYLANPYLRDMGEVMDARKWTDLYKVLALSRGKVACETLAICYWAKKPPETDFFNYGAKIYAGAIYVDAPGGFYDQINRKAYDYVVIESTLLPHDRLPEVLIEALFNNYRPLKSVGGSVLVMVPKS
jgi:xanthosine utilization system XapX-like protein